MTLGFYHASRYEDDDDKIEAKPSATAELSQKDKLAGGVSGETKEKDIELVEVHARNHCSGSALLEGRTGELIQQPHQGIGKALHLILMARFRAVVGAAHDLRAKARHIARHRISVQHDMHISGSHLGLHAFNAPLKVRVYPWWMAWPPEGPTRERLKK